MQFCYCDLVLDAGSPEFIVTKSFFGKSSGSWESPESELVQVDSGPSGDFLRGRLKRHRGANTLAE